MNNKVVVIGGGTAGMEVAGRLAGQGCAVTLVEREHETGGHVSNWHHLFPDRREGKEVAEYLRKQVNHNAVTLVTGRTITHLEKTNGTFILTSSDGEKLTADAVVIATGFELFRSELKEEYGYHIYDNVITSADLEKMFRAGEIKMADGTQPRTIGIVHCVGSRDEKAGNLYCSKLCCITAVKQAIEITGYVKGARVYCFYMDMRMGGAMYEEIYREAQEKYGINFIRGKVSEVGETIDHRLVLKAEDTLAGRPVRLTVDMIVLMAGMEISEGSIRLAEAAGLNRGVNRFFAPADNHYGSNLSNRKGIFYAGSCTAPMNITETISHARAAVLEVIEYLKSEGE